MRKFFIAAILMTSVQTFAQSTTLNVNETVLKANEVNKEKIEDTREITDSKLRADGGSLSRYSLKFSLSYYGPPVGDLSAKKQPNPDGSIGNFDTAMGGSISARYRLDPKSTLGVGTGINALTPFHGSERTDIKNPFIGYDLNSRIENLQMRNAFRVEYTSVPEYRAVGQDGALSYDNGVVYYLGTSNVGLGLDTSFDYFLYNREYVIKDRNSSRYALNFYPQVKYNISDKINIYTSLAIRFANPRSRDDEWALLNKTLSQRLGMGMAFSKTIYFAPYLNFYPETMNMESTTFSFATIFSIL